MTEKRGRPVSRRGLLGLLGRGAKGFRDAIEESAPALAPGARPPAEGSRHTVRRRRPPEETVEAQVEEPGRWAVDLRRRPLGVLRSLRVSGPGLSEPLLLARVHETHYAVVAGECTVDGSDLLWLAFEDRVACPSCGSRWRLDGTLTGGPADCDLASFLAEMSDGVLHLRAAGGR